MFFINTPSVVILETILTLRLSQNFSFWDSYLRFNGKNGCKAFSQELGTKPTEFWGKLSFKRQNRKGRQR
jgi:hypothetical protein